MAKRLASGPTRAIAANKALLRLWSQGGVEAADAAPRRSFDAGRSRSEDAKQGLKSHSMRWPKASSVPPWSSRDAKGA